MKKKKLKNDGSEIKTLTQSRPSKELKDMSCSIL